MALVVLLKSTFAGAGWSPEAAADTDLFFFSLARPVSHDINDSRSSADSDFPMDLQSGET